MTKIRVVILVLEIVAAVATIVLALLLINGLSVPDWEAWILLCGGVAVAAELCRRYLPKTESQASTATWLEKNVQTAKLSESLPHARQFAKRTGNAELERWACLELRGYNKEGGRTDDDVVPEYRAVTGRWMNQFGQEVNTSHDPEFAFINVYRLPFGVAKLEALASRKQMQSVANDHLRNILREQLNVEVTRFVYSPIEVVGILDAIRNELAEKVLGCLSNDKNAP
jgi:hypothetical protein